MFLLLRLALTRGKKTLVVETGLNTALMSECTNDNHIAICVIIMSTHAGTGPEPKPCVSVVEYCRLSY